MIVKVPYLTEEALVALRVQCLADVYHIRVEAQHQKSSGSGPYYDLLIVACGLYIVLQARPQHRVRDIQMHILRIRVLAKKR